MGACEHTGTLNRKQGGFPKMHELMCISIMISLNKAAIYCAERKQNDMLQCSCSRGHCLVQGLWCTWAGSMQAAWGHD
jgi:hypothetical protein